MADSVTVTATSYGPLRIIAGEVDFSTDAAAGVILAAAGIAAGEKLMVLNAFGIVKTADATGQFVTLEDTDGLDLAYLGTATVDAQGAFGAGGNVGDLAMFSGIQGSVVGVGGAGAGLSIVASSTGPIIQIKIVALIVPANPN